MINTLHRWGIRSSLMYTVGFASIGAAFASWAASNRLESAGVERADRWGIFVGEWAPTFFAMGVALRMEEIEDPGTADFGRHDRTDERASRHTAGSTAMH